MITIILYRQTTDEALLRKGKKVHVAIMVLEFNGPSTMFKIWIF